MAEPCNRAFGRYLRTLRERRGLSLIDVETLSQSFADPIHKAHLSRCENGRQNPGFSKIIALSRVYDVPPGVFVERMELDLEVDRLGGPDTEGLGFGELFALGREALRRGEYWRAYAFFRDARGTPFEKPLEEFISSTEQLLVAEMNCGTAALGLGRSSYTLHEFKSVQSADGLGPRWQPIVLERLSACHRRVGDIVSGRRYAELAVAKAEQSGDTWSLAFAVGGLANQAGEENAMEDAIALYDRAFKLFSESGSHQERARVLINLARIYIDLSRYDAARKSLEAAIKITDSKDCERLKALAGLMFGELEVRRRHYETARKRLQAAAGIAKALSDRVLRFRIDYWLLQVAQRSNNEPVERAITRRLQRLAPQIPADTPELGSFKNSASR